jgi:hypothetical protein
MRQLLLFVPIQLLGAGICLAIGPRRHLHLCGALGFLAGLAALVPPLLLIAAAGVPYGPITIGATALGLAGSAAVGIRRGGPLERRELVTVAGWTAFYTVLAVPVTALNLSVMSFDSHMFVALGQVLAEDRGFPPGMLAELADWGPFVVVSQSWASLIGMDQLYALPTLMGMSFMAVFCLTLWHGLAAMRVGPQRRPWPMALAAGALATTWLFHSHFLYIHTNLGSAIYLFLFVVLFWLAELEADPRGVTLAFLGLGAFSLLRVENPVATVLFLALVVLPSRLPRRALLPGFAGLLTIVGAWNLVLARGLPAGGDFLDPSRCLAIVGLLLAVFVWWLASAHPRLAALTPKIPYLAAIAAALGVVLVFAVKPTHMLSSADALIQNLLEPKDWGITWFALAFMGGLGAFFAGPPRRHAFTWGVGLYLGLILILAFGRTPYRLSRYDSGVRMSLHVLPLVFFYFGLKAVLAAEPRTRSSQAVQTRSTE